MGVVDNNAEDDDGDDCREVAKSQPIDDVGGGSSFANLSQFLDVSVGVRGHNFGDVSDDEPCDKSDGDASEDIAGVFIMRAFIVGDVDEGFGEGCFGDDVEAGEDEDC